MTLAPIALFAYNRPAHTRRVLDALRANDLAQQSVLYVFSDAPKSSSCEDAVAQIRSACRNAAGFGDVILVARESNFGLTRNITEGVTQLIDRHGKAIVIEDDVVTSRYFLRFMNDALARYEDDARVMHVAGVMYPIDCNGLPQTFFYRVASSHGWGTWQRAWRRFRKDPHGLQARFSPEDIRRFDVEGAATQWSQVQANLQGSINTWAVFWYASVFEDGGLCLHPSRSLIRNIGFDGSGEHCSRSSTFVTNPSPVPVTEFAEQVIEHPEALRRIVQFLKTPRGPWYARRLRDFRRSLKRLDRRRHPPYVHVRKDLPPGREHIPPVVPPCSVHDCRISIVTGTLNRVSHIPELIANTVDADDRLELVLVDGGSTDGTLEYLRQLAHPRIRLVEVGGRSSYPHFMNLGIRHASYPYVCQWNDEVMLAEPWSRVIDEIDDSHAYIFAWRKAETKRPWKRGRVLIDTLGEDGAGQLVMNYGIYHRSVFETIGLYNSAYEFYCADGDLTYRAWAFHCRIKCLPSMQVISSRRSAKSRRYDVRRDEQTYDAMRARYRRGELPDTVEMLEPAGVHSP
ncbi:MAG: glycosyltransferase [Chitinivibrionales bacterium]|nr:glycosyltransferase [Chitinivibrionales bacterium]